MKTALLMISLWSLTGPTSAEACTVLYRPQIEKLSASQQAKVQASLAQLLVSNGCELTEAPNADFQIELGYLRESIEVHGTELFKTYSDSESYFYVIAHHQGLRLYSKKSGLMINQGSDLMERGTTFIENKLQKVSERIKETLVGTLNTQSL